jgi:superfamily I DNA and/or RNA helicase
MRHVSAVKLASGCVASLFDAVIFDEASQIEPPDAETSIMRGRQLIVAGDEKQLPRSPAG